MWVEIVLVRVVWLRVEVIWWFLFEVWFYLFDMVDIYVLVVVIDGLVDVIIILNVKDFLRNIFVEEGFEW